MTSAARLEGGHKAEIKLSEGHIRVLTPLERDAVVEKMLESDHKGESKRSLDEELSEYGFFYTLNI